VDRVAMNVGTGREITINELARTVVDLCGGSATIRHAEARAGEIVRSVAQVTRAASLIDFRAQVVLVDGLRQTLA